MRAFVLTFAAAAVAAPVLAQYETGFEPSDGIFGNDQGIFDLWGQGGWYNPGDSNSPAVFTYPNPNVPVNPGGETQYALAQGNDALASRAQRDVAVGDGRWVIAADVLASWTDDGDPGITVGTISTIAEGALGVAVGAARTGDTWQTIMAWYDAAGGFVPDVLSDPGFSDLDPNHWYRWEVTVDFDTNEVVSVSITDIDTNVTTTESVSGRYMLGGDVAATVPTSIRVFAQAGPGFNSLGVDNVSVDAAPVVDPGFLTDFEAFEGYVATDEGEDLNGQVGWFNPDPDSSISSLVFDYDFNPWGIAVNPLGNDQFSLAIDFSDEMETRSQHDIVYGTESGWRTGTDILAAYLMKGDSPTSTFAGSLTVNTGNDPAYGVIAEWTTLDAEAWKVTMAWFDADGNLVFESLDNPAFSNLDPNYWYRVEVTADHDTNKIVRVTLEDLTTFEFIEEDVSGRYMSGGNGAGTVPDSVRLYAGNSIGNAVGFDYVMVDEVEIVGGCTADCNGDGVLNILDFVCFQLLFQGGDPAADCNGDGVLNILDFVCFQIEFSAGC